MNVITNRFARKGRVLSSPDEIPQPLDDSFERVETDVGPLWIARADGVMRPYMQRRGCWEPEEGHLLRTLLRPGMRFLDIGANVGYFTVLAGRISPTIEVEAVEPLPINLAALRFNLWANDVRASVWPLALDGAERSLELTVSPTNLGDTRASVIDGSESSVTVPAIGGDELFAGRAFDVIKIDVQGWELPVLQGMPDTLRASSRLAVVLEFWPGNIRAQNIDPLSVLEAYARMGFSRQILVADRLEERSDDDVVRLCDDAGPDGQVNMLLKKG